MCIAFARYLLMTWNAIIRFTAYYSGALASHLPSHIVHIPLYDALWFVNGDVVMVGDDRTGTVPFVVLIVPDHCAFPVFVVLPLLITHIPL